MTRSMSYRWWRNTPTPRAAMKRRKAPRNSSWRASRHAGATSGRTVLTATPGNAAATSAAPYSTHLTCCRSSPEARRRRRISDSVASSKPTATPAAESWNSRAGTPSRRAMPNGLSMYGQPLSGPGATAADSMARPRLPACNHSTGRQRADGSRPRGESSNTPPSDPTEAYCSQELTHTTAGPLRDIPVAVLSATEGTAADQRAAWLPMQAELAALSSRETHQVVEGATHVSLVTNREHAMIAVAAIHAVIHAAPSRP